MRVSGVRKEACYDSQYKSANASLSNDQEQHQRHWTYCCRCCRYSWVLAIHCIRCAGVVFIFFTFFTICCCCCYLSPETLYATALAIVSRAALCSEPNGWLSRLYYIDQHNSGKEHRDERHAKSPQCCSYDGYSKGFCRRIAGSEASGAASQD